MQHVALREIIEKQSKAIIQNVMEIDTLCGFYENVLNDDTHKNFIVKGLIKPLAYSTVTLMEALASNAENSDQSHELRLQFDTSFR